MSKNIRRLKFELIAEADDLAYVQRYLDILVKDHLIGGYTVEKIWNDEEIEADLTELVRS
jgi:hypothetical protein